MLTIGDGDGGNERQALHNQPPPATYPTPATPPELPSSTTAPSKHTYTDQPSALALPSGATSQPLLPPVSRTVGNRGTILAT